MNAVAAILILREADGGFLAPRSFDVSLEDRQVCGFARDINALRRRLLIWRGRKLRSPAYATDGHYLLSTPSPALGVTFCVLLVVVTGWTLRDPTLTTIVAVNNSGLAGER